MENIDPVEYEKRLERLGDIFKQISEHADQQALHRCPYKNRFNQCTAKFGCRYKRPAKEENVLPRCTSDDQLDYRTAWESAPEHYEEMRNQLQDQTHIQPSRTGNAKGPFAKYQDATCPLRIGTTLFDHADELAVRVPTSCGRTGHCHECIVEVSSGGEALSPRTDAEKFLNENYRLACQAVVDSATKDIEFALLRRSPQILTAKEAPAKDIDPPVTRRGDQVYWGNESIDDYRGHLLGLAVDLGTTTVVAELVDLESGQRVYSTAFENPQRFGGSDIMHRISYDSGPYAGELHRAIINTLNTEIELMCAELDIVRHMIYEIVIVGNATMRELFFGLDVQSIGQRPYKSEVENDYLMGNRSTTALLENARKLRIRANKNAIVYGAPLIASHVGGDTVADLVAINMAHQTETVMLVDAGTNTEVVLGNKDRLLAASCPAGPAFEGGLVTFGMPGCEGAVESLRYEKGRFNYQTIGSVPPQGICGSGLIDLVAELRRHELMTPLGVFDDRVQQLSLIPEQGITFSRADASHLAQAKAANYCGQIILLRKLGLRPMDIHRLYLAGGFANYVDPSAAVEIGFLAPVPVDRIEKVGNAAAQGARQLLLSQSKRNEIESLIKKVEHVELETMSDFFDMFVDGCQFKPMEFPD